MPARSLMLCCALLFACGGAQRGGSIPASARGILRQVPADTPYLFAVLAPPPQAYRDKARQTLAALRPRLEPVLALLSGADEPGLRFIGDLVRRVDLDQLIGKGGIDQLVLYGRGLLPVVRVRIADAAAVRRAIDEAAAATHVALVDRGHGMRSLRAGTVGDFVFGVREGEHELAIGFALSGDVQALAEHLAGQRPPSKSFIPTFVDLEGAARYGFGTIDSPRLLAAVAAQVPELSGATCGRELDELARVVPRFTFTTDEVTASRFTIRAIIELRADVAARLAALRVAAPGVGLPVGDGIFSLGFAMDLAKGVTLASDAAVAYLAMRHQCLPLRELESAVAELHQSLAAGPSVLGPYREVLGFGAVLHSIDPGDVTGFILLTASDPFQLFDMAKGFMPGLANIQLRGDGVPILIPAGTLLVPTEGYLAVRGQTLGLGVGKGTDRDLATAMAQTPSGDRPIFSFAADVPRFERMFAALGALLGGSAAELFTGPSTYRSFDVKIFFDERGIVFVGSATL